jgi:hypothetical protein
MSVDLVDFEAVPAELKVLYGTKHCGAGLIVRVDCRRTKEPNIAAMHM